MGTGQNIKALRKRDQLTQEEFAALIGVSKETVCRWEKDRYTIRRSTLLKIVSKFNLKPQGLPQSSTTRGGRGNPKKLLLIPFAMYLKS